MYLSRACAAILPGIGKRRHLWEEPIRMRAKRTLMVIVRITQAPWRTLLHHKRLGYFRHTQKGMHSAVDISKTQNVMFF